MKQDVTIKGAAHSSIIHDSAIKHVTGRAEYTDDLNEPAGTLHAYLGLSTVAHGRITSLDLDAVRKAPGVHLVLTADDVPGENDISATGIQIDGLITEDFLLNVFIPNTPLHDGAAIVRGKRLIAAGCLLPLTENRSLSTELGTRHRAAIGLSEQCDALVVVVSEETGTISVAENGRMVRHLDTEKLKNILRPAFTSPQKGLKDLIRNWRKKK